MCNFYIQIPVWMIIEKKVNKFGHMPGRTCKPINYERA